MLLLGAGESGKVSSIFPPYAFRDKHTDMLIAPVHRSQANEAHSSWGI